MKVTVDNVKFFEFLLDYLIEKEAEYEADQKLHDDVMLRYDTIQKQSNIFQKFMNNFWYDRTWHQAIGEDWMRFQDVYGLRDKKRHIKDTEYLVSVFAHNIQTGLTRTSEIEYTSGYLKEYIKRYDNSNM